MPLAVGDKLGPYEIVAPIGAGGMGEVYRAHDPRMGRDVAIKVAAERFSERFDREVRAVAALNHPHVCALYDVGPNYLVMELVEGPTLADRIRQGAIPLEETIGLAKQIAEALEAAHEKGIVHRDLKPANVKINREGAVKVLDFGLAKLAETAAPQGSVENSPTLTLADASRVGVIMGTAAYMSPEQASGKPVDKRADIWSFGVVLWEMLTGKQLFGGETISHTLADVLRGPIDLDQLPRETPASIRVLLRRCLDRDVRNRLRDIGEARVALSNVGREPEVLTGQGTALPHPWIAVAAVLGLVSIGLGALYWRATRPAERPLVRLDVDIGSDVSLPGPDFSGQSVVISADGTRLAYVASASGGPQRLFIRKLDQASAAELPGTDGARAPFFSPDGQWMGFFAGNRLSKISVEGGAAVPLVDVIGVGGAWWDEQGIIFGQPQKGLFRIPASGGPATTVTELASGEFLHAYPQTLPGGKAALFAAYPAPINPENNSIDLITFADHRRKTLVRGGTSPRYASSGHLLYVSKGALFAIPFDLDRLETRGAAVRILDTLANAVSQTGAGQFDVVGQRSGPGLLVYRNRRVEPGSGKMTVQWLDSTGKNAPLAAKPGLYGEPTLSPDGKRLALVVQEAANLGVWVYDPQRDTWTKLTFGADRYFSPAWSPDGRYVLVGTLTGIRWAKADGAGQLQPLTQSRVVQEPWSISPDGKELAYTEGFTDNQIWTMPLRDENGQLHAGMPERFLQTQFNDTAPAFSPDGRWLAYQSNESGTNEVYVRAFPRPASGSGFRWVISNQGGQSPVWSRGAHELLYRAGNQIMAVTYTVNGDTFVPEKPRVWLAKFGGTQFDLAPDGKRVAVLTPVDAPEATKADHAVVFLENFFDELRRRVPTGK